MLASGRYKILTPSEDFNDVLTFTNGFNQQPPVQAATNNVYSEAVVFNSYNPVIFSPVPWGPFSHGGGNFDDEKINSTDSSGIDKQDNEEVNNDNLEMSCEEKSDNMQMREVCNEEINI